MSPTVTSQALNWQRRTALFVMSGLTLAILSVAPQSFAQNGSKANGGLDLPDLDKINRPITQKESATINAPRAPSYHSKDSKGNEVTEYKDPNRATEIEVKSSIGTQYHMSPPSDSTPHIPDNNNLNRVPSVPLIKF